MNLDSTIHTNKLLSNYYVPYSPSISDNKHKTHTTPFHSPIPSSTSSPSKQSENLTETNRGNQQNEAKLKKKGAKHGKDPAAAPTHAKGKQHSESAAKEPSVKAASTKGKVHADGAADTKDHGDSAAKSTRGPRGGAKTTATTATTTESTDATQSTTAASTPAKAVASGEGKAPTKGRKAAPAAAPPASDDQSTTATDSTAAPASVPRRKHANKTPEATKESADAKAPAAALPDKCMQFQDQLQRCRLDVNNDCASFQLKLDQCVSGAPAGGGTEATGKKVRAQHH